MQNFPQLAAQYFERFSRDSLRYLPSAVPHPHLRVVVVVPAYREDLTPLLESLAQCDLPQPPAVELLLVINQPDGEADHRAAHKAQCRQYQSAVLRNGLSLRALDATDLPPRHAGVGLARKVGMDCALQRLAQCGHNGLIVNLDADCRVSTNYLSELLLAERQNWRGLALRFEHPLEELPQAEQQHIINYEIWLRYYVLALRWAQYPFAFHTVGSSMAVRAGAYAQIGGMNRRKAGEDFYFLHKLMPQSHFGECQNLCVYPQARRSNRVPFGTGRAMLEMAQGTKDFSRLYAPVLFRELAQIHRMVRAAGDLDELPAWRNFLAAKPKIAKAYRALQSRNPTRWSNAFFHFWDGFAVLRYLHFRQSQHPDIAASQACGQLLGSQGEGRLLLEEMRAQERQQNFCLSGSNF